MPHRAVEGVGTSVLRLRRGPERADNGGPRQECGVGRICVLQIAAELHDVGPGDGGHVHGADAVRVQQAQGFSHAVAVQRADVHGTGENLRHVLPGQRLDLVRGLEEELPAQLRQCADEPGCHRDLPERLIAAGQVLIFANPLRGHAAVASRDRNRPGQARDHGRAQSCRNQSRS